MHDCLKIEELLVIAGQLLPKDNEVTDEYEEIRFEYCPVCGKKFSEIKENN